MIPTNEVILRLLTGALLGGIIGFERQTHGRPAGFRTHLLVSVASTLLMIISEYYYYLGIHDPSYIRIDPARIAAGAITGVGFLGAGVIVKTGVNVQGLTTAACLWIVSAIGLSIGSGLYVAGVLSFAITFLTLWTLRMVERKMTTLSYKFITVVIDGQGDEGVIASAIKRCNASIKNIDYEIDVEKGETVYHITVSFTDDIAIRKILQEISGIKTVKKVVIRS